LSGFWHWLTRCPFLKSQQEKLSWIVLLNSTCHGQFRRSRPVLALKQQSPQQKENMKNEKYGLTDQKHDDQVVALELLLFGYACASLHDLNKLRRKLRQTEKKLRFSVQTEKIGPLSTTYDENMRKMKIKKVQWQLAGLLQHGLSVFPGRIAAAEHSGEFANSSLSFHGLN